VITQTVALFVGLLVLAGLIAAVAKRLPIPYVTLLAVVGASCGQLLSGHVPVLNHDLILFVFLPGLLFEAALNLDWALLKTNLVAVVILATLGVVLTTAVVALLGHLALGLPIAAAVLFGAAVSATDPVAVVATFRQLQLPPRLANLIEAESLLNDGTGVVVFTVALAALAAPHLTATGAVLEFLRLALGGLALGAALGWVMSRLTMRMDDPQIEMTLTAITAYGGYLLGQELRVSGILCVVAAGVVVGNYGRPRHMSEQTQLAVSTLWGYVAFLLNSAIFILIGAEVPWALLRANLGLVAAGTAVALLARAVCVYGLMNLVKPFSRPVSLRWQHLLVWGGLRGAVAIALILSLSPVGHQLQLVRAVVFGVVLTSIIIQGGTIGLVSRRLLPRSSQLESSPPSVSTATDTR